jgi:hydrogenase nickel incorporation protein HypB
LLENVGNLVCTADFDLGAHKDVVILSIPEGDDKPLKYPLVFVEADAIVINKMDVLPYFNFDLDAFAEVLGGLNPSARVFRVSAKTGEGMSDWFSWVEETLA